MDSFINASRLTPNSKREKSLGHRAHSFSSSYVSSIVQPCPFGPTFLTSCICTHHMYHNKPNEAASSWDLYLFFSKRMWCTLVLKARTGSCTEFKISCRRNNWYTCKIIALAHPKRIQIRSANCLLFDRHHFKPLISYVHQASNSNYCGIKVDLNYPNHDRADGYGGWLWLRDPVKIVNSSI